jgi:nucleotide-binding universal stress UspA family protein
MFHKFVLGFDGSDGARLALERTAELAAVCGAEVLVVAVGRLPEYAETRDEVDDAKEHAEQYCKERVKEAAALLAGRSVSVQMRVEIGKPSDVLIRVAEAVGADLIVLGANPHSVLHRRVVGATADKVVDRAHCTVMIVR